MPNISFEAFAEAAKKHLKIKENEDVSKKILGATASFLLDTGLVNAAAISVGALESFGNQAPIINNEIPTNDPAIVNRITRYLSDCGIEQNKINPELYQRLFHTVGRVLNNRDMSIHKHFSTERDNNSLESLSMGVSHVPLVEMAGSSAYANISADQNVSLESFGVDMDKIASDVRLNLAVSLLRTWRSLADRVFPRKNADQNVILIDIPEQQVSDLEKAQDPKADVRWGSHRFPFLTLYKRPDRISTAPKKIVPLRSNDTAGILMYDDEYLKPGVRINLFDLASDPTRVGFSKFNDSDLIGEGGKIDSVLLEVTRTDSGVSTSEVFVINTRFNNQARYMPGFQANIAADRLANISELSFSLQSDSKTADGSTTTILTPIVGFTINLGLQMTSSLNLQNAYINATGQMLPRGIYNLIDPKAPVSSAVMDEYNKYSYKIVGWKPDLEYNEENLRKTSTAIRITRRSMSAAIPLGRTIIYEFSLQQEAPGTDVVDTITNANGIGNTARCLNIVESHLLDVNAQNAYEAAHPELPYETLVARSYPAGSMCYPTSVVSEIDFSDPNDPIYVMREAERPTEFHARMQARLHDIFANISAASLFHTRLAQGETPNFRIIAWSPLVDLLFGIKHYHNAFNDETREGGRELSGADYCALLPNGTRIDVYKTDFLKYKNRMLITFNRMAAPLDVTNFCTIYDRGTFTGRYTVTENNAAFNRTLVNSREWPFVTNPIGCLLSVKGLEKLYPYLEKDIV